MERERFNELTILAKCDLCDWQYDIPATRQNLLDKMEYMSELAEIHEDTTEHTVGVCVIRN